MIIKWLFRRTVRSALGLVHLISRRDAVPQCSMHLDRCLPVPCLPCSCLHHAILLVVALFMSRHCVHTVRLHPHSVFVMLLIIVVLYLVIHLTFLDSLRGDDKF